jgi:hypothetical protein
MEIHNVHDLNENTVAGTLQTKIIAKKVDCLYKTRYDIKAALKNVLNEMYN